MKKLFNKTLSILLTMAIVLSLFAGMGTVAFAASNPNFSKVADAPTLDGWREFFGTNFTSSENAGGVWTDKSVFADNNYFTGLTDAYNRPIVPEVADDSFLVALSAIASNKSIVGYSHIPTDTVLVLDISGSMGPSTWGSNNNNAVSDLVLAANAAMTRLLDLNRNNRVGIVLYSAAYDEGNNFHYTTLLPIDRYEATGTVTYNGGTRWDTSDDVTVGKFLETNANNNHNGNEVSIASGVSTEDGNVSTRTVDVVGGTFIQGGLQAAADLFKAKSAADDTIIKGDGFQSGTQRKPVMVLMSDGAPTYATTNYTNATSTNRGNGQSSNETYAFLTQLTAAYVKNQISGYYNDSEALFYTLGLGVGNSSVAQSVLNPSNSTNNIKGFWEDYLAATNNATVEITDGTSVIKDADITDFNYSNLYSDADTGAQLFAAFDEIVNQIILQSLYRPTLVENNNAHMEGYIEFIDDIGDYMKIEEIEGIWIGDKLFTGEKLSENFREGGGALGTVENPNALGDNLIWAVKERLGIESTAEAQTLVGLAYDAGQLKYGTNGEFSNFIGWYADKDGKYIGFWNESHTYADIPDNAKYVNKSYGMLGEIANGYNESDLMYVSIQVHTEIVPQDRFNLADNDTIMAGRAQLIFRVPASLIPVVTYDVSLEGTGYDNARNIEMTVTDAEPIRLLFEVGLRDDVNEYNIEAVLGNNNRAADGKYVFYTNQWSVEQFEMETDNDNSNYIHPTDSINTLSYFEPNYENERYYYTEPTPVYIKNGSAYAKYSSDTKPTKNDGNEYYRQINVFELTGVGNNATLIKKYERISDIALERVEKSDVNGGWNIQKETIHRVYDEIETPKAVGANATETLAYSYFPTVEHIEGTHYYADAILGNNGKLTVTPATGIAITKNIDETLAGVTHAFEFSVDIGDSAATYQVVRKGADGMYNAATETITLDGSGVGKITINAGETVLIVGLPAGVSYKVEEIIPAGADYVEAMIVDDEGIVELHKLNRVEFVNTLRQNGSLVISKQITHPFTTAPDSINNHIFKFDVILDDGGAAYPDTVVEAYYSNDTDNKFNIPVVNNVLSNIELKGNQSIVIAVKSGWNAVVTEDAGAMPEGFALSDVRVLNDITEVSTTQNVVYVFTNNYAPAEVSPNVTINASKNFTGRPWNNDNFTFVLYRYDPHTASQIEIARETINQNGDFGSVLTAALKNEKYTHVGTYQYSIKEIVPTELKGITFDSVSRDFHIIVTDNDTDGKLEIGGVENLNLTSVTSVASGFVVTANQFVNTYKADGIAEIIFEINKKVSSSGNGNYGPEGFEFGLYDKQGNLVSPLYSTNAEGKAQFTFTYNADNVSYNNDKVIEYIIKETDTQIPGMTYAADIPVKVSVKDNLDGTISASADIGNANNDIVTVDVTNYYNPDNTETSVTVDIEKTVENKGTLILGPEGFEFVLKGKNGEQTEKTDKDGKAQFTLNYDSADIGETYTYTLSEVKGDLEDMEYSKKEYEISVQISLNAENKVVANVLFEGEDYTDRDIVAEFTNTNKANIPVEPTPEPTPAPTPTPAPEVTSPQTGYNRNIGLLLGVLFVSGGLAVYTTLKLNKKETEE